MHESYLKSIIIRDLLMATMPDGSPISLSVKVDKILETAGIRECPAEFKRLLTKGTKEAVNDLSRQRRKVYA